MIWGYPNDLGTIMNHPYQNINPTDCGWNKLWYGLIVVKLTIINPNYIVLKCLEVITQYSYSPDSSLSPHWGAPPCGWGRAPDGNRRRFLQVSPTWTYLFGDIWRPLPYYVWIYQSYSITINLMWSDLDIYIYKNQSNHIQSIYQYSKRELTKCWNWWLSMLYPKSWNITPLWASNSTHTQPLSRSLQLCLAVLG